MDLDHGPGFTFFRVPFAFNSGNESDCTFSLTSGSRGVPGPAPRPPDLEGPVIQFGGPVYILRAKQLILGPFFIFFQNNF